MSHRFTRGAVGKRKFSDWLEFLHAAAAARGVVVYPEEVAA